MASRVTPTEVKQIVDTALLDPVVQIWIDSANTILFNNLLCLTVDEIILKQIELFLSAHFIAMLDAELRGFVTKEKVDVFETTYSNPINLINSIDNTPYGTTANMLSGGCLANTSDKLADIEFF